MIIISILFFIFLIACFLGYIASVFFALDYFRDYRDVDLNFTRLFVAFCPIVNTVVGLFGVYKLKRYASFRSALHAWFDF